MSQEVDEFLEHFGVPGMKWGKHRAKTMDYNPKGFKPANGPSEVKKTDAIPAGSPRPKMSKEKKIAIAIGVGATVAIGAAIAISVLNNKQSMELPIHTLHTNSSAMKGKANLIFKAAAMPHAPAPVAAASKRGKANLIFKAAAMKPPAVPAAKRGVGDKLKEKAFNRAKDVALKKAQKMSYSDAQALLDTTPKARVGLADKAKGMAVDKAKEIVINQVKNLAIKKASELAANKAGGNDGLDLGKPKPGNSPSGGDGLDLGKAKPGNVAKMPAGPSLNVLSDVMNGGPHVTYNSKTGKYETK